MRTLKLGSNNISVRAGDAILDALYRNLTLTSVDLSGNQLDHVQMNKYK